MFSSFDLSKAACGGHTANTTVDVGRGKGGQGGETDHALWSLAPHTGDTDEACPWALWTQAPFAHKAFNLGNTMGKTCPQTPLSPSLSTDILVHTGQQPLLVLAGVPTHEPTEAALDEGQTLVSTTDHGCAAVCGQTCGRVVTVPPSTPNELAGSCPGCGS